MTCATDDATEAAWDRYHAAAQRAQAMMADPAATSLERLAASSHAVALHARFVEALCAPTPADAIAERNRLAISGTTLLCVVVALIGFLLPALLPVLGFTTLLAIAPFAVIVIGWAAMFTRELLSHLKGRIAR